MIARLDHRPMLTAALALSTIVLVVVAITLTALLITSAPATNSQGIDSNPSGHPSVVEVHRTMML